MRAPSVATPVVLPPRPPRASYDNSRQLSSVMEESPLFQHYMLGAQRALRAAVAPTTLLRYRHSLPRWQQFVYACFPRDATRYIIPTSISSRTLLRLCHAFIDYLRRELAMSGRAISTTLTGLCHEFRTHLIDTAAFRDPSVITVCRRFQVDDDRTHPHRGRCTPLTTAVVLSLVTYLQSRSS